MKIQKIHAYVIASILFAASQAGASTYYHISLAEMNVVPIPAAVWLFASGLGFLGWTGLPWLEGPKKK